VDAFIPAVLLPVSPLTIPLHYVARDRGLRLEVAALLFREWFDLSFILKHRRPLFDEIPAWSHIVGTLSHPPPLALNLLFDPGSTRLFGAVQATAARPSRCPYDHPP